MKANGSGFVSNETTIIDGNVGIDFFAGLLDNRPLKFAGVAFASFATIFVVAATYGIIWYFINFFIQQFVIFLLKQNNTS